MTVADGEQFGAASRHFLECRASRVRWLPSPRPGPPDEDGVTRTHKLVAMSSWSEGEDHRVSIVSVNSALDGEGRLVEPPSLSWHATWEHAGEVTDLQVVPLADGEIVLLASSSEGHLSRARLRMPSHAGASPDDYQVRYRTPSRFKSKKLESRAFSWRSSHEGFCNDLAEVADREGGDLSEPWAYMHDDPVTAFDVCPWDTLDVAAVGRDGGIHVVGLLEDEARPVALAGSARGGATYSAVRWTSRTNLVTAGSLGGLTVWDRRQAAGPAQQGEWGDGAGRRAGGKGSFLHCLQVHRDQPHLCAVGGSGGACLLWDMRHSGKPLSVEGGGIEGDVWEVKFDVSPVAASMASAHGVSHPPVVMCSEDGVLRAQPDASGSGEILRESCAINSFDIEPSAGRDIVCATENECLLYLRR